jgi:aminopeptidase N
VRVVGELLADDGTDAALRGLALGIPDPAYVATLETTIDPDGIVVATTHVEQALAAALRGAFEDAYRRHRPRGPYSPAPAQAGPRSLSNLCLRYLCVLDDDAAHSLAREQYDAAGNMTDTIGALAAMRDSQSSARDSLYARFEAKWRDEPLVLDKWFALQARSLRADTLGTVRALVAHPQFNARNPNRVRSLVGAFALGNFARFHARDGSGYAFAAEQIRALDRTNPQLAATIAGAFSLWKRFAEPRRSEMQRSLERIARARALSPDLSEIVARTLMN